MSQWSEFYKGRLGGRYQAHVLKQYAPFINRIIQAGRGISSPVVNFREEGAGIGTVTAILQQYAESRFDLDGWKFEMVDRCPEMAELAFQNTGVKCEIFDIKQRREMLDSLRPHIIHSHGVLEHFEDDDIKAIIDNQRTLAKSCVIAYVPTNGYESPSFGDERLLDVKHWVKTFRPNDVHVFNNGCDLMLYWRA